MQIVTIRLDTGLVSYPFEIRGIARVYIEKKNPRVDVSKNIVAYNKTATPYEEECATENANIINSYFNLNSSLIW